MHIFFKGLVSFLHMQCLRLQVQANSCKIASIHADLADNQLGWLAIKLGWLAIKLEWLAIEYRTFMPAQ